MHPFEHLRYVARARNADPVEVARDSAYALAAFAGDPLNLTLACRRLVQRQPGSAPLWWMASHLLVSDRADELIWDLLDRLGSESTAEALIAGLPQAGSVASLGWSPAVAAVAAERDDVVLLRPGQVADAEIALIEAVAACEGRLLAEPGSAVLVAAAHGAGSPVWCVIDEGRRVPVDYVEQIAQVCGADEIDVSLVTHLVTRDGVFARRPGDLRPDCPFTPELLRRSVI